MKGDKKLHTDKKILEQSLEWVFAGRTLGEAGSWSRNSNRKKVQRWEMAPVTQQFEVNGGTGEGDQGGGDVGVKPQRSVQWEWKQSGLPLRTAAWATMWKMQVWVRGGKPETRTSIFGTFCKNLPSLQFRLKQVLRLQIP